MHAAPRQRAVRGREGGWLHAHTHGFGAHQLPVVHDHEVVVSGSGDGDPSPIEGLEIVRLRLGWRRRRRVALILGHGGCQALQPPLKVRQAGILAPDGRVGEAIARRDGELETLAGHDRRVCALGERLHAQLT